MQDGYILKNKSDTPVSSEELTLINKLTRRKFSAEEVYVFSVVLCDNDIDRDYDRFTNEALEKLEKLYVGKTGILDHKPTSENQTARIFKCTVESVAQKTNSVKEPYKRLLARAYMPRSSKNENIILEIDSGIKKEVSVGCAIASTVCSICGKDLKQEGCAHIKGRKYKKGSSQEICHAILDNPTDAYEWSFVAVPAQREAGVVKVFSPSEKGGETKMEDIIKSLNSGERITLTEVQASKLFQLIASLKEKAKTGDCYREELKSEILKLSALVQPEVNLSLMKSISEKLSVEELKSFKDSFKSRLSQILPPKPQFNPEKSEHGKNQNIQFKI